TLAAQRALGKEGSEGDLPNTERDLPIGVIGLLTLICLAPIPVLLANFDTSGTLGGYTTLLVGAGMVYIILVSFFVSSVCGYMAGLIGSSNSPLSGIGILATLGAALLMVAGVRGALPVSAQPALVAYALFVTAVGFCLGPSPHHQLQDLNTRPALPATP